MVFAFVGKSGMNSKALSLQGITREGSYKFSGSFPDFI